MVVGAERAARPVRPRFLGAKPRSATRRLEEEGNVERCSRERVRGSGGLGRWSLKPVRGEGGC